MARSRLPARLLAPLAFLAYIELPPVVAGSERLIHQNIPLISSAACFSAESSILGLRDGGRAVLMAMDGQMLGDTSHARRHDLGALGGLWGEELGMG